jgi:hypothetical protein
MALLITCIRNQMAAITYIFVFFDAVEVIVNNCIGPGKGKGHTVTVACDIHLSLADVMH